MKERKGKGGEGGEERDVIIKLININPHANKTWSLTRAGKGKIGVITTAFSKISGGLATVSGARSWVKAPQAHIVGYCLR